MVNWRAFPSADFVLSENQPFIIFKHSPRCSISLMAKSRFERQWNGALEVPIFLINVLEERNLSNQVAHHFQVPHQSPQLLVIQGNKCIYYASHNAINAEDVEALLNIKK